MVSISARTGGLSIWENNILGKSKSTNSEDPNRDYNPKLCTLPLQERINLCSSVAEEVLTPENLSKMLASKSQFVAYDGFEPSGRMHIAQGIFKAINVNKITKAGGIFVFWIADWFAQMNHKMGGDINKITTVGNYFVEIWRAAGMDLSSVKFLWASQEIIKNSATYWPMVIDIASKNSVNRIQRCGQIMGRDEGGDLAASQIFYPCMQCADIFHLQADVTQLGLDQRKVNVLALEYCDILKKEQKPCILSSHMILGLAGMKMSKSDPDSAIFMEDSSEEIVRKIKKAFCPPGEIDYKINPILDYVKHIIFEKFDSMEIERTEENGGNIILKNYEELTKLYEQEIIHPGDLKPAVSIYLNKLIEPVRQHFLTNQYAKELLAQVKTFRAEES